MEIIADETTGPTRFVDVEGKVTREDAAQFASEYVGGDFPHNDVTEIAPCLFTVTFDAGHFA